MKKRVVIIAATVLVMGTLLFGAEKSKVLMKVGNEVITEEDLEMALEEMPDQYKDYYSTEDGKKQLLERMAEQKMLAMKAKEMNLDKTKEFEKVMEKAKEMALAQQLVKKLIMEGIKSTDEEIREKYEKNKEDYKKEEEVSASHILIKTDAGMSYKEKEGARKKALDIWKKLMKGADFAKMAKKYSDSPEGDQNGGELGWFSRDRMVKEFSDEVFAGKVGKIIPHLVETQFGYHIIKVTGKRPAGYMPIEEAREKIEEKLLSEKRNEAYEKLKEELKEQYPVQ